MSEDKELNVGSKITSKCGTKGVVCEIIDDESLGRSPTSEQRGDFEGDDITLSVMHIDPANPDFDGDDISMVLEHGSFQRLSPPLLYRPGCHSAIDNQLPEVAVGNVADHPTDEVLKESEYFIRKRTLSDVIAELGIKRMLAGRAVISSRLPDKDIDPVGHWRAVMGYPQANFHCRDMESAWDTVMGIGVPQRRAICIATAERMSGDHKGTANYILLRAADVIGTYLLRSIERKQIPFNCRVKLMTHAENMKLVPEYLQMEEAALLLFKRTWSKLNNFNITLK